MKINSIEKTICALWEFPIVQDDHLHSYLLIISYCELLELEPFTLLSKDKAVSSSFGCPSCLSMHSNMPRMFNSPLESAVDHNQAIFLSLLTSTFWVYESGNTMGR